MELWKRDLERHLDDVWRSQSTLGFTESFDSTRVAGEARAEPSRAVRAREENRVGGLHSPPFCEAAPCTRETFVFTVFK